MRIFSSRGFTLLEIMIVISIIGILATALFPSFNSYIQRGRDTSRVTNIDTIAKSLNLYYSEKEDYPPADIAWCVDTVALANYVDADKVKDPQPTHINGQCSTPGSYAYGMSTGLLVSPDEYFLMTTTEQPFGGNYTGSITEFTGTLNSIAYTSGTTLSQKGSGPYYIRMP